MIIWFVFGDFDGVVDINDFNVFFGEFCNLFKVMVYRMLFIIIVIYYDDVGVGKCVFVLGLFILVNDSLEVRYGIFEWMS